MKQTYDNFVDLRNYRICVYCVRSSWRITAAAYFGSQPGARARPARRPPAGRYRHAGGGSVAAGRSTFYGHGRYPAAHACILSVLCLDEVVVLTVGNACVIAAGPGGGCPPPALSRLMLHRLAQMPDGLLWAGPDEGVYRFDGTQAVALSALRRGGAALPPVPCNALLTTPDDASNNILVTATNPPVATAGGCGRHCRLLAGAGSSPRQPGWLGALPEPDHPRGHA